MIKSLYELITEPYTDDLRLLIFCDLGVTRLTAIMSICLILLEKVSSASEEDFSKSCSVESSIATHESSCDVTTTGAKRCARKSWCVKALSGRNVESR